MIGPSKILTVSFGTFSCTLEGFEDSFETMKDIAEYFRDLAEENPHFGAEPAKLDTEALSRIAARKAAHQVEATQQGHEVTLRPAAQRAADQMDHPAVDADGEPASAFMEPDFVQPDPRPSAPMDDASIAAKLRKIRAITGGGAVEPLEEMFADTTPELVEDAPEESFFAQSEERQAPVEEDTIDLDEINVAELSDAEDEPAELMPEIEDVEITDDEDRSEPDLDAIAAVVAQTAPDITAEPEEAIVEDTPEAEVVKAADIDLSDIEAPEVEAEDTADIDLSDLDLSPDEAAAPVAEAIEDAIAEDTPIVETDAEAEDVPDLSDILDVEAPDEDAPEVAIMSDTLEADAPIEGEIIDAVLDADDADMEAVDDAIDAEPVEAIAAEADEEPEAVEPLTDEEVTPRVRARIIRMRRRAAADTATTTPEAAEAPVQDDYTDLDGLDELMESEPAAEAPASEDINEAPAAKIRPRRPTRRQQAVDDTLPRLMSEADTALDAPEASARRNALAHLKAAIAATEAERKLGDASEGEDEVHLFRDDLEAEISEDKEAALAPLRLVASQRIDVASLDDDIDLEPEADEAPREERYVAFCESTKAGDEYELLESAAVFLHDHEGLEQFGRPQLIRLLQYYDPDLFDRKEGLKAFNALVDQGRLEVLENGRVTVTDKTNYRDLRQRA